MMQAVNRDFDLNIEKVLDGWSVGHAVRELIANALDEQTLSGTDPIEIARIGQGIWSIRDFGRGLRHTHLTQNENLEKNGREGGVIGRFGVGLKDALAVLDRRGIGMSVFDPLTTTSRSSIRSRREFSDADDTPRSHYSAAGSGHGGYRSQNHRH